MIKCRRRQYRIATLMTSYQQNSIHRSTEFLTPYQNTRETSLSSNTQTSRHVPSLDQCLRSPSNYIQMIQSQNGERQNIGRTESRVQVLHQRSKSTLMTVSVLREMAMSRTHHIYRVRIVLYLQVPARRPRSPAARILHATSAVCDTFSVHNCA